MKICRTIQGDNVSGRRQQPQGKKLEGTVWKKFLGGGGQNPRMASLWRNSLRNNAGLRWAVIKKNAESVFPEGTFLMRQSQRVGRGQS